MQPTCSIVLVCVTSPILVGIYEDAYLKQEIKKEGKTSEILPEIFEEILRNFSIKEIFYARGPGNFSAIKLAHVFLHTLAQINNISLHCTDSFFFTRDKFIHAYGRIHFFKENEIIKTAALESISRARFELPNKIDVHLINACDAPYEPLYILPAV